MSIDEGFYRRTRIARLIKFSYRCCLLSADGARNDFRNEIVFCPNRFAEHPPEHCDLSHMGESVRNRTLEDLLWWKAKRFVGSKTLIQRFESAKETRNLLFPRQRSGLMVYALAVGKLYSPI